MKNNLLITLIFITTFSFAQNFEKKVIAHANMWLEPKVIDLDNDGLDDIVSVSLDGNIAYWKKNSDFTFSKIILLQEGGRLWQDFDVFDMDNDGDLDLLLVQKNILRIFHNDGNQNFSEQFFDFNFNSSNIIAGDFDDDGYSDFITTKYFEGDVKFWKNTANTSYQDFNIGQASPYTGDALANDIDDDGDLDLIIFSVYYSDDSHKIYLNDGNANFTELVINYSPSFNDIQILDFDNDGDYDIVGIHAGQTVLLTNDGNLNFTNSVLTDNNQSYEYDAMKIADYDNDGDYDISVLFNTTSSIFTGNFFGIYINDGNNNFTLNALEYLREGESLNYFDYNSDGLTDFLATSKDFDDPRIYDNQGNGTFNTIIIDDVLNYPSGLDSNDIDNDGLIDIVTTSDDEFELVLWHNIDNLNFDKIIIDNSEPLVECASIIDFNNDGNKDIISGYNTDFGFFGGINLYTNDGNLNFTESSITNNSLSINEIFTLDLNNDSYTDIITLDYYKQLIYYLSDGTDGFQTGQLVGTTESIIKNIDYIDIDNDGYKDLITGEDSYFKNDGSMNFTNTALPASGVIYDLDNDGDFDILSHKTDETTFAITIVWYENDGSGNYTEHEIDNSDYNMFTVDDFDGDGDIDFVAGHKSIFTSDSTLSFYINDGNQSFTREDMDYPFSNGTFYLTSNDYDGDGDIDILRSTPAFPFIIWENKSDVSLSSYQTNKEDFYKLYPNPVTDYLKITPLSNLKSIEIFDTTGKKITSLEKWNLSHIDVSVLSAGIYYLIIEDINNKKHNLKFIKE